jgi:methionyl-tRNA formyltransferase
VPLRIVFCGTPAFALPTLLHLISQSDFSIEAVITQPDRPGGRGQKLLSPAVKDAAIDAGIAVYQPEKIKSDSAHDFLRRVSPDAVVIIAYGQIVPSSLIAIPRLGWINLHASLLPKYRGAAPINWAIVNGETATGVTTMQIDSGLDTGAILFQEKIIIGPDETAPELYSRLAELGAPLMAETLRGLEAGRIQPRIQDHAQASIAPQMKKENGRIDWGMTASQIYNRIRGFQPWPGAYTFFRGKRCEVWAKPWGHAQGVEKFPPGTIASEKGVWLVACGGDTTLRIDHVQLEGRKKVSAQEFSSGARIKEGERFGD